MKRLIYTSLAALIGLGITSVAQSPDKGIKRETQSLVNQALKLKNKNEKKTGDDAADTEPATPRSPQDKGKTVKSAPMSAPGASSRRAPVDVPTADDKYDADPVTEDEAATIEFEASAEVGTPIVEPVMDMVENDAPTDSTMSVHMLSVAADTTLKFVQPDAKNWMLKTEAKDMPYWLNVAVQKDGVFTIKVDANPASEPRKAVVTISYKVPKDGAINKVFGGSEEKTLELTVVQNRHIDIKYTDLEFANVDKAGKIITDYGQPFKVLEMRMLSPRLTYDGPETATRLPLTMRLIRPNGNPLQKDITVELLPGNDHILPLSLIGDAHSSKFTRGKYTYELLDSDGNVLIAKDFEIARSDGQYFAEFVKEPWITDRIKNDDSWGMYVHTTLHVEGLKEQPIRLCVFVFEQGKESKDAVLESYQETGIPQFNNTTFNDWMMFIPYDELDKLKDNDKKLSIIVQVQTENGEKLCSSQPLNL